MKIGQILKVMSKAILSLFENGPVRSQQQLHLTSSVPSVMNMRRRLSQKVKQNLVVTHLVEVCLCVIRGIDPITGFPIEIEGLCYSIQEKPVEFRSFIGYRKRELRGKSFRTTAPYTLGRKTKPKIIFSFRVLFVVGVNYQLLKIR